MYGGAEICHTGGNGFPSEEAEANAKLIASAPTLLAALENIADLPSGSRGAYSKFVQAKDIAIDAIRKAKGME